jgi:hypothetical protein
MSGRMTACSCLTSLCTACTSAAGSSAGKAWYPLCPDCLFIVYRCTACTSGILRLFAHSVPLHGLCVCGWLKCGYGPVFSDCLLIVYLHISSQGLGRQPSAFIYTRQRPSPTSVQPFGTIRAAHSLHITSTSITSMAWCNVRVHLNRALCAGPRVSSAPT